MKIVTQDMMTQFIAAEPEDTLVARLSDLGVDSGLDGKKGYVILSVKGFKALSRKNLIDYLPDAKGRCNVPMAFGMKVIIPGHGQHSAGCEYAAVAPRE